MAKRRGNGEGSIYKDADDRWRAEVDCGFHKGKRKRKKISGRTRAEVSEKLTKALRDKQQGLPFSAENQNFGRFIVRWLEEEIRPKRAYNTYRSYSQQVYPHIVPGLGKYSLSKLSAQILNCYLNEKLASGGGARTLELQHAIIRSALTQALKWDLVPRNIAMLVTPPKAPKRAITPYDSREAVAFYQAVKGHRLQAVFTVAVACGLREGETLGLQWTDINLSAGQMNVRTQLQRGESRKLSLKDLKTEKSKRLVELPQICLEGLFLHQQLQAQERKLAGRRWVETGLVFTTTIGTGIDQRNLLRSYSDIINASGLRKITFHDLRHTAASLLLAMGVPMHVVSRILGHTDIRTTINIYGHVFEPERKQAAGLMDTLFQPVAPELAPNHVFGDRARMLTN